MLSLLKQSFDLLEELHKRKLYLAYGMLLFDDPDWPLNASRGFVSISWASCICLRRITILRGILVIFPCWWTLRTFCLQIDFTVQARWTNYFALLAVQRVHRKRTLYVTGCYNDDVSFLWEKWKIWPPVKLKPLSRLTHNLSGLIMSTSGTFVPNLVKIRSRGTSGQRGEL